MSTYTDFLASKLNECIFQRDVHQRQLEFVVDTFAEQVTLRSNNELHGNHIVICGKPYTVVDIRYCKADTEEDHYNFATFEVMLVANDFTGCGLDSEEARICSAALRRQITDGEADELIDIYDKYKNVVVIFPKTVPVDELPTLNFSMSELNDYFEQEP